MMRTFDWKFGNSEVKNIQDFTVGELIDFLKQYPLDLEINMWANISEYGDEFNTLGFEVDDGQLQMEPYYSSDAESHKKRVAERQKPS